MMAESQYAKAAAMKTRTFLVGFGISAALLAVCAWYAFVSPQKLTILSTFDPALHGWHVHQPGGYNACILLFAGLNLPAIVAAWVVISVLDSVTVLVPAIRAVAAFATAGIASSIWWLFLAKWRASRASRRE